MPSTKSAAKPLSNRHTFEAIGTVWAIDTDTPLSDHERSTIANTIESFDTTYSRFRPDSLVSRVAHEAPGTFTFPASITELYDIYRRLESATNGAVNPLVGASLEQLGYDANYTLQQRPGSPIVPPALADVTSLDQTKLTVTQPVLIDIGAVGKGYLVNQLARVISPRHHEYVIDAGGDIAIHRSTPETIGLEHPLDPTKVIGSISLQRGGLCASATNRRSWGKGLHHILDARTGLPTSTDIVATWAIAGSTAVAEALSTALFFVPAEQLRHVFDDFHYVTMKADGSVTHNIHRIGTIYS